MKNTNTTIFETGGPRSRRRIRIFTTISTIVLVSLIFLAVYQFYLQGQLDPLLWEWLSNKHAWSFLLDGLVGTLSSALGSSIIAIIAGFLVMLMRTSTHRLLRWPARIFIEFGRGTPTLLLIYFMFTVPGSFGLHIPSYWQLTAPIAVYATAVVAEIYRTGINAIPTGQKEAAAAVGLSTFTTYKHIIIPQTLRIITPTLMAQLVVVVKDTTFGYVVSYAELMHQGDVLRATFHSLLPTYLVIALIYIAVNALISQTAAYIARKHNITLLGSNHE
ncbi:MAG: amino acid ABC transporter permease [Actinomycetaceae bacterium]|nr:amino acid ABC transporter permease [Actinomycetaceae bacterium]